MGRKIPKKNRQSSAQITHLGEILRMAANMGWSLLGSLGAAIMGLGASVILARGLGVEARGQLAEIMLLPSLAMCFFCLGLPSSSIYYFSKKEVSRNKLMRHGRRVLLVSSVLGFGFSIILIELNESIQFWVSLSKIETHLLIIAAVAVPLFLIASYWESRLKAEQRFKAISGVTIMAGAANLLMLVYFFVIEEGGVLEGELTWIISRVVSLLAYGYILNSYKKTYLLENGNHENVTQGEFVKYGLVSGVTNVISFLNYRIDFLVVSIMLGAESLGFYVVAVALAEKMWLLPQTLSSVLFAQSASYKDESDIRDYVVPFVARQVIIFSLLGCVCVALVSHWVVVGLYGESFSESRNVLLFLLPGIAFGAFSRVLANDIAARGYPKINAVYSIVALVINTILNVLLIARFGLLGAAIATSVTYVIITGFRTIAYSRISGIGIHSLITPRVEDFKLWKNIVRKIIKN